jgi:uroporphyrinogen-III synthase
MSSALAGKSIVNTRAVHQAPELDDLLIARGAIPLAYPCIAIAPPEESAALEAELERLAGGYYHWLALTSINTVEAIAPYFARLGLNGANPLPFQIAAVGSATAAAVRQRLGVPVDVVPEQFSAAALGATVPVRAGERVLLPGSEIAKPDLREALERLGVQVAFVTAYRTVRGSGGTDVPRLLASGDVDAVTFVSSSAVEGFFDRLRHEGGAASQLEGVVIACIGPGTAATLRQWISVEPVVPRTATLRAMVDALEHVFAEHQGGGIPR